MNDYLPKLEYSKIAQNIFPLINNWYLEEKLGDCSFVREEYYFEDRIRARFILVDLGLGPVSYWGLDPGFNLNPVLQLLYVQEVVTLLIW